MANKDVAASSGKVPAHLSVLADNTDLDEWLSGTASGFPVLSIKGNVFHIRRGDEVELVCRADDPDEPATKIEVVVLRSNRGIARTYYKDKYIEGSDDAPTCYSNNGVSPEPDAEDKQSKKCATCPHAQWGSRITENNKKGKACSEVKRLAIAPVGDLRDPMLLRVPPTSLKAWDNYVSKLANKGLNPTQMVTAVRFDPSVSHQSLQFKAANFVTNEMLTDLQAVLQDNILESIIGTVGPAAGDDVVDEEEEDDPPPPPKKKQPAKKSTKQVAEEEEDELEDLLDGAGDEEEEEEEPPPPPKKKAPAKKKAAPKKKKAPAKKKAAPKQEPEEEEEPEEEDGGDGLDGLDFDDIDWGDDAED